MYLLLRFIMSDSLIPYLVTETELNSSNESAPKAASLSSMTGMVRGSMAMLWTPQSGFKGVDAKDLPADFWHAWSDGSYDFTLKQAAAGGVIIDSSDAPIALISCIVPKEGRRLSKVGSSYDAELAAFMYTLEAALSAGAKKIHICIDSQSLLARLIRFERLNEACKADSYVKEGSELLSLLNRFEQIAIQWIPREKNTLADILSKRPSGHGLLKENGLDVIKAWVFNEALYSKTDFQTAFSQVKKLKSIGSNISQAFEQALQAKLDQGEKIANHAITTFKEIIKQTDNASKKILQDLLHEALKNPPVSLLTNLELKSAENTDPLPVQVNISKNILTTPKITFTFGPSIHAPLKDIQAFHDLAAPPQKTRHEIILERQQAIKAAPKNQRLALQKKLIHDIKTGNISNSSKFLKNKSDASPTVKSVKPNSPTWLLAIDYTRLGWISTGSLSKKTPVLPSETHLANSTGLLEQSLTTPQEKTISLFTEEPHHKKYWSWGQSKQPGIEGAVTGLAENFRNLFINQPLNLRKSKSHLIVLGSELYDWLYNEHQLELLHEKISVIMALKKNSDSIHFYIVPDDDGLCAPLETEIWIQKNNPRFLNSASHSVFISEALSPPQINADTPLTDVQLTDPKVAKTHGLTPSEVDLLTRLDQWRNDEKRRQNDENPSYLEHTPRIN